MTEAETWQHLGHPWGKCWCCLEQEQVDYVRFEVFIVVTMKNAVFWDVALCRYCVNRRFGGTYRFHLQGRKIRERGTSVSRWLQTKPCRSRVNRHFKGTYRLHHQGRKSASD
jgi:hypothetical protein